MGAYSDSTPNSKTVAAPSSNPDLRFDISEAMSQLSPEHRVVIALQEVQGFDYQEIAEILEIPIGTLQWLDFCGSRLDRWPRLGLVRSVQCLQRPS